MKKNLYLTQKIFLYILIQFAFLNLYSQPTELISKDKVIVGEEIIYTIEYKDKSNCKFPEKDFLLEKDTPYGEISDILIEEMKATIKIIFYKTGKFKVPVSCENFKSDIEIEVSSVLEGEKEALDITEPFLFSGKYISRLLLIILILSVIFIFISYILWKYKSKFKKKSIDADFIPELNKQVEETYKSKLTRLVNQIDIPHKEFIFLLSGYIKEKIELKLKYPLQHFTQKELNEILIKEFHISNIDILSIDTYFNSVKYMPNEENISQTKAFGLIQYWDRLIR